jgi:hypothetical protein
MDSQLTLVTVAPEVRLMFDRDSMKNAALLLDSVPAYTIFTGTTDACTELRVAGPGELLARVARKGILPDTITFPTVNGGREMGLKKWLKKSKLSDGSCAIVPILICSFHQSSSADTCKFLLPSSIHVIGTENGNFALKTHPVHRLAMRTFLSFIHSV